MLLKLCGLSTLTAISTVILHQEGVGALSINSLADTTTTVQEERPSRGRSQRQANGFAQVGVRRTAIMDGMKRGVRGRNPGASNFA